MVKIIKNYYDNLGNIIKEEGKNIINYLYDKSGNIVVKHDHYNNISYSYNNRNLLISEYSDLGRNISYKYNNENLLIEQRYGNDVFIKHTYDEFGRLKEKSDNEGKVFYFYLNGNHSNPILIKKDLDLFSSKVNQK